MTPPAGAVTASELAAYGKSIDELAELGYSFDLDTPHGQVRLVPRRSAAPEAGVLELSFADARALAICACVFPGSRVTKIRRP